MSKETMTAEVKEAIAKTQEFADAGKPEKVSGTVEPTNKPETGKQKQKLEQKSRSRKRQRTERRTEKRRL